MPPAIDFNLYFDVNAINAAVRSRDIYKNERSNLYDFVRATFRKYSRPNWHHELICDVLQRAVEKKILRLMLFVPPRHMKSENLERALAFSFGKNMDSKAMVCGYGDMKSRKISRNVKSIVKEETFSEIFPMFKDNTIFKDCADTQDYWELGGGNRGSFLSAGVGSAITGEGFNIAAIDDPHKNRAEADSITYQENIYDWYTSTFLTRQDEVDSVVIIVSTRWHPKDLCGRILEAEGIDTYNTCLPADGCPDWNGQLTGKWTVINLPAVMEYEFNKWRHPLDKREVGEALWPGRFPLEHLEQFQKVKYDWQALFQGMPKQKEGAVIKSSWLIPATKVPSIYAKYIRFWDLAGTPKEAKKHNDPDFTAGVLCAQFEGVYYIVDIVTARDTPAQVEKLMARTAKKDAIMYEDITQIWEEEGGASGKKVTEHYLQLFAAYKRRPFRSEKAKMFYLDMMANKAETGDINYIKSPWNHDVCDGNTFFDELNAFPRGNHDDRIDAAAKGIYILARQVNTNQEFELKLY